MLNIKVYQANGATSYLDLNPNSQLRLEELAPAFDDKLDGGIFSLPIELPWTSRNKIILGYAEHINTLSKNIPEYWRCDIETDGVPYIYDCKLKLIEHKGRFDARMGSYSFTVSGIKGIFGALIKNKKLRDLELGGPITWDPSLDSRDFAFNVMNYQEPLIADKLNFSPVYMDKFHDPDRDDYRTEFLAGNVVNNIVINPTFPDGWLFAREKSGPPGTVIPTGISGYENYRTVPFLRLFFVLRQIFSEHGFTVSGEIFDYPDFDLIHIFNNVSIDLFHLPFYTDLNRQIIPSRHLPDMLISDFLIALQNALNLKFDFLQGSKAFINFKQSLLTSKRITDISSYCYSTYNKSTRHEAFESGIKLEWGRDDNDQYFKDKVKETEKINIVAEVEKYADIVSATLPSVIDANTYVYVQVENYFYNFNTATGNWEPALEQHDDWQTGKGQITYSPELSPLCHHYSQDIFGNFTRSNMVGVRQKGSYYTDSRVYVEHEFELRLFYIKQIDYANVVGMPISFCHNYDVDGIKLVDTSLSWRAPDGLYNKLWATWILMLQNASILTSRFNLNINMLQVLSHTDILLLHNNQYLLHKSATTVPVVGTSAELELIKI